MDTPNGSHENVMDLIRLTARRPVTGGSSGPGTSSRRPSPRRARTGRCQPHDGRLPLKAANEIAESTGRRATAFAADVTSADESSELLAEIEDCSAL